ncbi:MAG: flagellar biosynthesis protein [Paucibacter sp.]|nr:flagellar biosynthesis protein [Roseateles sp.]
MIKPIRQVPEPERRQTERRTSYARFIPSEELSGVTAWTPGALNGPPVARPPISAPPPPAAAPEPVAPPEPPAPSVDELLKDARQAGYQDGYRDGLAALDAFKQSFSRQLTGQLGGLVKNFDADLHSLEEQMALTLTRCAVELARQVVRSEIETRPELIARVAHDAVEALQLAARHIRVRVHPDDFPLVVEGAGQELRAREAQILPDPEIARGGCTVDSDLGSVDATMPARWQLACASLGQTSVWQDRRSVPPAEEG